MSIKRKTIDCFCASACRNDRSVVPSRCCLDVRIPLDPLANIALPEDTEAVLRLLSSQTLPDDKGEGDLSTNIPGRPS